MSTDMADARQGASSSRPDGRSGDGDFEAKDMREQLNPSDEDWARWHCKLVDFGNACWTHNQLTTDIQTRQYRCPEVRSADIV